MRKSSGESSAKHAAVSCLEGVWEYSPGELEYCPKDSFGEYRPKDLCGEQGILNIEYLNEKVIRGIICKARCSFMFGVSLGIFTRYLSGQMNIEHRISQTA